MPWIPRIPDVIVVAEAQLGNKTFQVFARPDKQDLPEAQEGAKMAVEDTPALPDPAEVHATWERLRASVMRAYDQHSEDAAEAARMIGEAEAAQAKLRADYPMFFQGEEDPTAGATMGNPTIEQQNIMLRTLAERPGSTLKQIARQTNWSRSWSGRILQVMMTTHPSLISRGKMGGREFHYRLTDKGMQTLDQGGFRGDDEQ